MPIRTHKYTVKIRGTAPFPTRLLEIDLTYAIFCLLFPTDFAVSEETNELFRFAVGRAPNRSGILEQDPVLVGIHRLVFWFSNEFSMLF